MKKISLILILTFIPVILFSLEFGFSYSMRNAKEKGCKYDYEFATELNVSDRFYGEIEKERENGESYLNYELKLMQKWANLTLTAKRDYIDSRDKDKISLTAKGRYLVDSTRIDLFILKFVTEGYWNAGLRQEWDKKIPSTNVVFGRSLKKELNFFLFPAVFEYSLDFYSSDFVDWKMESEVELKFEILTYLDFFMRYKTKDKDVWQYKTGVIIDIPTYLLPSFMN